MSWIAGIINCLRNITPFPQVVSYLLIEKQKAGPANTNNPLWLNGIIQLKMGCLIKAFIFHVAPWYIFQLVKQTGKTTVEPWASWVQYQLHDQSGAVCSPEIKVISCPPPLLAIAVVETIISGRFISIYCGRTGVIWCLKPQLSSWSPKVQPAAFERWGTQEGIGRDGYKPASDWWKL